MTLNEQVRCLKRAEKLVPVEGVRYLVRDVGRVEAARIRADARDAEGTVDQDQWQIESLKRCVFDPDTGTAVDWGSEDVDIPSKVATKLIGEIFLINGWIDAPDAEDAEKN